MLKHNSLYWNLCVNIVEFEIISSFYAHGPSVRDYISVPRITPYNMTPWLTPYNMESWLTPYNMAPWLTVTLYSMASFYSHSVITNPDRSHHDLEKLAVAAIQV